MGDPLNKEKPKTIVGPELVFSKDHNLLMYSKAIFTQAVTEKDDYNFYIFGPHKNNLGLGSHSLFTLV